MVFGWGIDWIVHCQAIGGSVVTQVMASITFLGSGWFYLLVMPAVLWSLDTALGVRLGLVLLASASLNSLLKLAFGLPRPYWVDRRVRALAVEASYGLPSGHAQNAVALWGYLAYRLRRWWATAATVLLILAIGFSRVYLGVHFPADVAAGWIVGGILLTGFIRFEVPVARWFRRQKVGTQLAAAGLVSLSPTLLGWIIWLATAGRQIPAEWIANILAATGAPFTAQSLEGVVSAGGALFGFSLGAVLLADWSRFNASGDLWRRLARYLIGVAGAIALQIAFSPLAPDAEALRFLRYAAVGLWIAYGAPRSFVALRLA